MNSERSKEHFEREYEGPLVVPLLDSWSLLFLFWLYCLWFTICVDQRGGGTWAYENVTYCNILLFL